VTSLGKLIPLFTKESQVLSDINSK
jgi:hypothetical protein